MKKNTIIYIVIAVLAIVLALVVIKGVSKDDEGKNNDTSNTEQAQQVNKSNTEQSTNQQTTENMDNEEVDLSNKFVTLDVAEFGSIKIELNVEAAPKTSENFLKLVQQGFYNNLTFHRVAQGFVIQGGDPDGTGAGGPGYTIPAEIGLPHVKGAVAMARQGDQVNPERESSGSQFYIALEDIAQLDGQYTVFAQVVEGMDVVAKIGGVPITPGPFGGTDGAPQETITITSATASKE